MDEKGGLAGPPFCVAGSRQQPYSPPACGRGSGEHYLRRCV